MATQPTNLPVPSESPRDLKFNAGKIDEFVTSTGWTYNDRFGNKHYTIEGINHIVQEAMTSIGYVILVGQTFTTGATLNSPNEILLNEADNSYYKWTGSFASGGKEVPPDSTPESTGGIGSGKWRNVGDSSLRSDLATGGKATLIGYNSETVQTALERHDTDFNIIVKQPNNYVIPDEGYSGFKRWNPIEEDGKQLGNYVFKTPTHVDFKFSGDPINTSSGPVFKMGRDDLDQRSAFFSQDSYEIRNVMLDGGTGKLVDFEPWTSHMAKVENCRIINPDEAGQWAINFKAQNWWPHVIGNTHMGYNGVESHFVKAIDDGGNPADRYTANSRLLIANNRCAWQGGADGAGIMSYTSGAGVRIKDNSAQNASICSILGYPSTFSTVDGLYAEMNYGNQVAVQVGDSGATSQQVMSDILVKDLYVNLHGNSSNRIIVAGSSYAVFNYLEVDRLFASNIPSTGFIQPIVTVPDTDFHKIVAGRINAANCPLIPLTSKNIVVIDKYGCSIPSLNGDLIYANATTPIPANSQTVVAPGWFAKCTTATTFSKSGSSNPTPSLRMARNIGQIDIPAGSTGSITFEHVRADSISGNTVTFQFLVNFNVPQNALVNILVINDDGSQTVLYSGTSEIGGGWKEITKTVSISGSDKVNSFIAVSVTVTPTSSGTLFVTAHRKNLGAFGLCHAASEFSYSDVNALKDRYIYVTP